MTSHGWMWKSSVEKVLGLKVSDEKKCCWGQNEELVQNRTLPSSWTRSNGQKRKKIVGRANPIPWYLSIPPAGSNTFIVTSAHLKNAFFLIKKNIRKKSFFVDIILIFSRSQ